MADGTESGVRVRELRPRAISTERTWLPAPPLPLGLNRVLLLLWCLAIVTVSSFPHLQPRGAFKGRDKLAHAVEYSVLGYLLGRACWERIGSRTRRRLGFALVAGVMYGVVDELYQGIVPGRVMSAEDLLADSVGVVVGVVSAWRASTPPGAWSPGPLEGQET